MIRLSVLAGVLLAGLIARAADPVPEPAKDNPAEVDVGKTTELIIQGATDAGKRLGAKDIGADTQRIQKEILKNIDALIKKAQEPPPPMNGSDSSPSNNKGMGEGESNSKQLKGGGSQANNSKQPMGGGGEASSAAARKERRDRRNSQANGSGRPMQQGQPTPLTRDPDPMTNPGSASTSPNKIELNGMARPRMPDVYKDVWGHLPEKMRQEMDLYFREQFMPRYSDLLRQYYSSLAERSGPSNP